MTGLLVLVALDVLVVVGLAYGLVALVAGALTLVARIGARWVR